MTAAAAAVMAVVGLAGLIVGSFVNVVIHRVPSGESIVRPRSRCPQCGSPITPRDNVPVLSWLALRGRCRHCRERIPARYPLVELATAVLWVGLTWWALAEPAARVPLLPLLLVLAASGVALWVIDLDHHRLPDAIVLPLYPVTAVGLAIASAGVGVWPWTGIAVGVAVWVGLIGGLWLLSGGRGMGFGDVKLAPVLGATTGWISVGSSVVGLVTAFVVGAVVGVVLLLTGRAQRRSAVPFGPFLLLGALVGVLAGPAISQAYGALL